MSLSQPWLKTVAEVLSELKVQSPDGLSAEEAQKRLERFGSNEIKAQESPSILVIFIRQFKSLLSALLAVAALISMISQDWLDAFAILLVMLMSALIGFVTELRAISSMESLKKMGTTYARVFRAGAQEMIPSEQLVPGDLLHLEAGDVVPADGRIVEAQYLNVDESSLTGESVPVVKSSGELNRKEVRLSDRTNMVMRGTHITRGVALVALTHTGSATELGRIAQLASTAEEERTPLEKRLDQLGKKLVWVTLLVAVLVFLSGLFSGKDLGMMLQTAIALAVATVPEGLPIVATIALAKGVWLMSQRNALVNRLSAVETLGATSVIVTDKTGTLTENRMTVAEALPTEGGIEPMLRVLVLCNDAEINGDEEIGDPMEIALLRFNENHPAKFTSLKAYPRIAEEPFDSEIKMMATVHKLHSLPEESKLLLAVKGAPEAIINRCSKIGDQSFSLELKNQWREKNRELANTGLRVLAIAHKESYLEGEAIYSNLNFLGLVGLIDPARGDVPKAIENCQKAGIRVLMATGDQAGTALKIAKDIGISQASDVYSRVSPEQKLDIVKAFQKQGYVVAMTGDGVNDAPALKKADIGVAMGMRGTQVAREAADMVLKDDRFETILHAVLQGRVIFVNIRKFVVYLMSCNMSEVFVVGLAALLTEKLPITPLQILFLNLVTDVFPALALGMGVGGKEYLSDPPRSSKEGLLEATHWRFIFFYGFLITALVLGFYLYTISNGVKPEKAVTMSFLILGVAQVFHVFNLRKSNSGLFVNDVTTNPHIWGALVLCLSIFWLSVQTPILSDALSLVALTPTEWFTVLGLSLVPALGQFIIRLK